MTNHLENHQHQMKHTSKINEDEFINIKYSLHNAKKKNGRNTDVGRGR